MSALKTKSRKVPRKEAEEPSDAHKQRIEEDALSRVLSDTEAESLLAAPPLEAGPLSTLIPVFVDIETKIDKAKGLSLSAMTLRQYLAATELESIAIGIGDEPIEMFYTEACGVLPPGAAMVTPALCRVLAGLTQSKQHVFVAHNAPFDSRGVRFLMDVPHPVNMWCTMEGAMAAWPELPGGFGLANVGRKLQLPKRFRKLELDLDLLSKLRHHIEANGPVGRADLNEGFRMQLEAIVKAGKLDWDGAVTVEFLNLILGIYNRRDVESMRAIYKRELARIPAVEQWVGIRTHHQRRHHFEVMQESLDNLIVKLHAAADKAADTVGEVLRIEGYDDNAITHMVSEIFNRGETVVVKGKEVKDPLKRGHVQSIRYARLKNIVNDHIAEEHFDSVSQKKINPVQLARNPSVGQVLEQTTRAGKMVSHLRRSTMFTGVNTVDVELGYCRAHTGRFSSPAVGGRGLNLHNVPKHDKEIAEPVRKLFRMPTHLCLVRGDLANVEYRCISKGTPVYTDRGWVPIEEVCQADLVWDGCAFVTHQGVVCQGSRQVIDVHGVRMTPDHPVLSVDGWVRADQAATSVFLSLAPSSVTGPSLGPAARPNGAGGTPMSPASAEAPRRFPTPTSCAESLANAGAAQPSGAGDSSESSRMRPSGNTGSRSTRTSCSDATIPTLPATSTMAAEESRSQPSCMNGLPGLPSSRPPSTSLESTSPSNASTTMATTSPAICDSPPWQSRTKTSEPPTGTQWVYDLIECGPQRRFVVGAGTHSFIVHNCEGFITKSPTVLRMFDPELGGDIMADPYCLAWKAMTGVEINKKNPIRQVAKEAVLGLGFRMSAAGYAKTLLKALAKGSADILAARAKGKPPPPVVTEQLLEQIICDSGWMLPEDGSIQYIMKKTGCSQIVAVASYHIHRLFNESHYEFGLTADWLVAAVHAVAQAGPGAPGRDFAREQLARAYTWSGAPDPDMIGLEIDDDPLPTYPSVRVRCGPWPRTVIWREPHMRINPFEEDRGARLSIRKANGSFKSFSPQLAVENITQAAARNALCMGVAQLDTLGYRDVLHVHDEVMLIVPRTRESVLAAREALLKVFGPGHSLPHKWAILIKPNEVSVTESLYESEDDFDPKKGNRWGRIEQGTSDCLLNLP